jgi:hypothetical protein
MPPLRLPKIARWTILSFERIARRLHIVLYRAQTALFREHCLKVVFHEYSSVASADRVASGQTSTRFERPEQFGVVVPDERKYSVADTVLARERGHGQSLETSVVEVYDDTEPQCRDRLSEEFVETTIGETVIARGKTVNSFDGEQRLSERMRIVVPHRG